MDKSATYVRMCEKAREVQGQWVQHHGDVFVADTGKIVYWISEIHKLQRVKSGFVIDTKDEVIYLSKVIWLPRQDQLIEMAQEAGRRYDSVLQSFFNWTDTPYEKDAKPAKKIFPSMEQIWIAFVMQKNYGKKWTGYGWDYY